MPAPAFNPAIADLSLPPVPAVQAWANDYSGAHGPLIDLSQAVPGYPPHRDLLAWLAEAAGSTANTGYGAIEGESALREAYARHVSDVYGAKVGAANIHITAGCNQAFVAAVMAVAGAGDSVLVTNPFYFNHETTLKMLGIGVVVVDCPAERGFLPNPGAIAAALKPGVKALALVSPNNPTGAVYPPALLAEIFDLCRAKGVWFILDETYRDFLPVGGGAPHGLFSSSGWDEGLIGLYSFSKSYCIPGHRVGAITAGEALVGQVAKIMDNLQICAPRPPQAALARAIPGLTDWRAANTSEIGTRTAALRETMAGLGGWQIGAVGAYFAYIRHPFDAGSAAVSEALAKRAGILSIPGEFFGAGQEQYLRFAFANADSATIRRLRARLQGFSL
jgi:aspartate/methionine/tyrosine aminotransferase